LARWRSKRKLSSSDCSHFKSHPNMVSCTKSNFLLSFLRQEWLHHDLGGATTLTSTRQSFSLLSSGPSSEHERTLFKQYLKPTKPTTLNPLYDFKTYLKCSSIATYPGWTSIYFARVHLRLHSFSLLVEFWSPMRTNSYASTTIVLFVCNYELMAFTWHE
jgi:hypothetical protein